MSSIRFTTFYTCFLAFYRTFGKISSSAQYGISIVIVFFFFVRSAYCIENSKLEYGCSGVILVGARAIRNGDIMWFSRCCFRNAYGYNVTEQPIFFFFSVDSITARFYGKLFETGTVIFSSKILFRQNDPSAPRVTQAFVRDKQILYG